MDEATRIWERIVAELKPLPFRTKRRFKLRADAHPDGMPHFERHMGIPPGKKDWRAYLKGTEAGLHVQELQDGTFSAHIDEVDPRHDPIRHGVQDAPLQTMLLSTLGCAAIGALSNGKEGAARGATWGGLTALGYVMLTHRPTNEPETDKSTQCAHD